MAITNPLRRLLRSTEHPLLQGLRTGTWPRGGAERYINHGIPRSLLESLQEDIHSLSSWRDAFRDSARRYRAWADTAAADNDRGLAARYYLVSASCAFHAQLLPAGTTRRRKELQHMCRVAYQYAAPLLDPPAVLAECPYKDGHLRGYLRLAAEPLGTVVLLNGQATCKEDLHYFTQPLLDIGLNTLCVDSPGTGEALPLFPYAGPRATWEPIKDYIAGAPALRVRPVMLLGIGVGAITALHIAANQREAIQAVAAISPPYDLQPVYDRLVPWVRDELRVYLGCESRELEEAVSRVRSAGLAKKVSQRVLIVAGGKDIDFPKKQARQLAKEFGNTKQVEYWGFSSASHGAYEKFPLLRMRIAQWLGRRVGAKPPRREFDSMPGE